MTAPALAPAATALVFVVPMPPSHNRSGRTRNPYVIAREKKAYGRVLDLYASHAWHAGLRVPAADPRAARKVMRLASEGPRYRAAPAPPAPIHNAVVTVTELVVGATNDEDNLAYRVKKWLGDWLVTRGYVATDMPHRKRDGASLTWAALPPQHVTRREPPRITLTLEPREP